MGAFELSGARFRWRECIGASYALAFLFLILTKPFNRATFVAIEDLAGVVPAFLAAGMGIRAGLLRRQGWMAWLCIGLGILFWASGEAVWTFYEVILMREVPFPSLADAGYLGAVPLLFAGVVLLAAPQRGPSRLRIGLDSLAFVAAAAAVSWQLVIRLILSSEAGPLERWLSAAYPIGDLVLLFALLTALPNRRHGPAAVVLTTLSLALLSFLLSDSSFAYLATRDDYSSGSLVDFGWVVGNLLFAYAAWYHSRSMPAYSMPEDELVAGTWRRLLPLLVLPPLIAWSLSNDLSAGDLPARLFIVAYVTLVALRHAISYLDTLALGKQVSAANTRLQAKAAFLEARLTEEQTAADLDALTGVLSRRAILRQLEKELGSASSRHRPVAVGSFDIDGLKPVNDRNGHAAGDQLIRRVASTLVLEGATVGRVGGDEFLVILPGATEAQVRVYLALVDWRLSSDDGGENDPSVSAGFAIYPDEAMSSATLIGLADQRMYEEKARRGRRRNAAA